MSADDTSSRFDQRINFVLEQVLPTPNLLVPGMGRYFPQKLSGNFFFRSLRATTFATAVSLLSTKQTFCGEIVFVSRRDKLMNNRCKIVGNQSVRMFKYEL